MIFAFLFNFVVQYRSLTRLLHFLIQNKLVRWLCFLFSIPLSIIYLAQMIKLLIFYIGMPAINMTSYNFMNNDDGCQRYFKTNYAYTFEFI